MRLSPIPIAEPFEILVLQLGMVILGFESFSYIRNEHLEVFHIPPPSGLL